MVAAFLGRTGWPVRGAACALAGLLWSAGASAESGATPGAARVLPRVASASVCADQFVLALADRAQIVALSPDARTPGLSLLADRAAGLPLMRPSAEGYLDAGVDVVVSDGWSSHQTAALMARFGVTVVTLPLLDDLTEIAALTRRVGAALGHPARGEALADATERRIDRAGRDVPGEGRRTLYLRPDGGTAAEGSFVAAVLDRAGLRNQATEQGKRGWAGYDLEHLLIDPPDLLVTSFFDRVRPGTSTGFGTHPAFRDLAAGIDRVEVPGATWVCGGWILAAAAEHLADGLRALGDSPAGETRR